MKTTKLLICAVAAAAAFAAASSKGQTITSTVTSISPGENVRGTFNNGAYVLDFPAGVLHFTDFNAFCVEPTASTSLPETITYQIQDPITLANNDAIARIVAAYLSSSQDNINAAAAQWAIWEIVIDPSGSYSLSSGNNRIMPSGATAAGDLAVSNLANQYLTNINNYAPAQLTYLTSSDRQDVVTWNTVPEPSTIGLGALSCLVLLRRRRA